MTYAKVIADSINERGDRLTTMEVRFHRFVLAEFNTHRVFSRNSASSRAIPLHKQIERVTKEPAMPVSWPAEQKGMQGGDEVPDEARSWARSEWAMAAGDACVAAERIGHKHGVHKSVANRILEPFMWHTVIVTSTAWDNFFTLRCDKMAQPEIRVAAELMCDAMIDSKPEELELGQWHLPYTDADDWSELDTQGLIQVSAARCARVSYLTQDGKRDHQADLDLYDRLTGNGHSSPLEHVATPMPGNRHSIDVWPQDDLHGDIRECIHLTLPKYGNFLGWHQHRFDVEARRQYRAFA